MSGKVTTNACIKYGRVNVRARIPKGDWIWPGKPTFMHNDVMDLLSFYDSFLILEITLTVCGLISVVILIDWLLLFRPVREYLTHIGISLWPAKVSKTRSNARRVLPSIRGVLCDWLIDWIAFYAVSAIFQSCQGDAGRRFTRSHPSKRPYSTADP